MEELQSLVLSTLDKENTIPDTRKLTNAEGKSVDQLALYAALNSLALKEVSVFVVK
jgi:hypothetical protein